MYKLLFSVLCLIFINDILTQETFIENFNENANFDLWTEQSDTVKNEGKSKASLVFQKTASFQRAVLFVLLNPQPCGAAFAGVTRKNESVIDLGSYSNIALNIRGQGQFKGYKLILKQQGMKHSFCNFFEAPDEFKTVTVAFDGFKPYYEGKLIDNALFVLDKSKIQSIGIQAYGGAYLPVKQTGVASLEINWIKAQ